MKEIKRKPAANLIAFRNGIYDISEDKFFQFSPEYVIRNTHILILKKIIIKLKKGDLKYDG